MGLSHAYYISLIDANSEVTCGSTNISAESCTGGVCKYTYRLHSSKCLNSENIIAYLRATNVLGRGAPYNTTIGNVNDFYY